MRVGFKGSISEFLREGNRVVSELMASGQTYCVLRDQGKAWVKEVEFLQEALRDYCDDGRIYFEYDIPRMAKRADVVVLARGILFVIEFKVSLLPGERDLRYEFSASDQVDEYAHDFAYFHSLSHTCPILPIVFDNAAVNVDDPIALNDGSVYKVVRCNSAEALRRILDDADQTIPPQGRIAEPYMLWECGVYEPTPTIVQAAESLYSDHTVEEITRSGAGAEGINNATTAINSIVDYAKQNHKKVICFLTGVPGAGKTLVGLNLVTSRNGSDENRVFLSGNYPLVKVLQESIIRNRANAYDVLRKNAKNCGVNSLTEAQRAELEGLGISFEADKVKGKITRKSLDAMIGVKIQLVSRFRSGYDEDASAPNEHVFVFDEAQRAWSAAKLLSDEKRTDSMSEPDILLSYLDRHDDWCVAVALVGGGQDIHDGEAGIIEWYRALGDKFADWEIYLAQEDQTDEFAMMQHTHHETIHIDDRLYLNHPMRSFRAMRVSEFVEAILSGNAQGARLILDDLSRPGEDGRVQFPVFVCRDLEVAKQKVRSMAHGLERYGSLISARAKRLRHYGLFSLGQDFNQIAWFLDGKASIDSSYSMEVAASEFKVQGLEIDYSLVGWDGDFMFDEASGSFKCQNFSTSSGRWEDMTGAGAETKKRYLTNAYRVILTRARQGMVIYIPTGDLSGTDATVPSGVYDPTYRFLHEAVGIKEVSENIDESVPPAFIEE